MMEDTTLVHELNYKTESLVGVIDTYDTHIYPLKKRDPEKYNKIMERVYDNTHKSPITKEKREEWNENFPNMIDRKIESEKKKIKYRLRDPMKSKKAKHQYKTSQFRNQNIIKSLESKGYYGINRDRKMDKMKEGLKHDEITNELVSEISDQYGGDHDMVEINYDKQFKQHIKDYENRYKYAYVVEDLPEEKKIEKLFKPKQERMPSKPIPIIKEKISKKKPAKLKSSIVVSKNPIRIISVKRLEFLKPKLVPKEKPIKKEVVIKKKPVKKKIVAVAKKIIFPKKKIIPKKKPIKKVISQKKKISIKKKPEKKKIVVKKAISPKRKPRLKKKTKKSSLRRVKGHYRTIKGVRKYIKGHKARIPRKKKIIFFSFYNEVIKTVEKTERN